MPCRNSSWRIRLDVPVSTTLMSRRAGLVRQDLDGVGRRRIDQRDGGEIDHQNAVSVRYPVQGTDPIEAAAPRKRRRPEIR